MSYSLFNINIAPLAQQQSTPLIMDRLGGQNPHGTPINLYSKIYRRYILSSLRIIDVI